MYKIKVYRICNDIDYELYVGSTKQLLKKRLRNHFSMVKKGNTRKIYQYIRIIGKSKFYIQLLEIKEVEDKNEQLKLEQKWMNIFKPSLNMRPCIVTKEQTKNRLRKWGFEYRDKNVQMLKNKRSTYYELNKEKEKRMHTEYVERNRESVKANQRAWHERNKQRLNNKRKIKMTCECGSTFRKSDRSSHNKSKKHKDFFDLINN